MLVEGVGDEVLMAGAVLLIVLVLSLAWLSTGVRPLWSNDSVWYVQIHPGPTRRILRLLHIEEAAQLPSDPQTETVELQPREVAERDRSPEGQPRTILSSTSSTAESSLSESEVEEDKATTSTAPPPASPSPPSVSTPPTPPTGDAQIRLKFLDETQRLVGTFLSRTVGEFKRQHFETEVSSGQVIRLIYQGQLLRDDARSLESYGLTPGAILHCHVSTTPLNPIHPPSHTNNNNTTQPAQGGLGMGRYVYVIFGFKFLAFWAFYLNFPEFFDLTSILSLLLLSLCFAAFVYNNMRPRPELQPNSTSHPHSQTHPPSQTHPLQQS